MVTRCQSPLGVVVFTISLHPLSTNWPPLATMVSLPLHVLATLISCLRHHCTSPTPDSIPVTVQHSSRSSFSLIIHFSVAAAPIIPPPLPTSLAATIATLPPTVKWAFDFLDGLHNSAAIAQAIANRTCVAVSDRSLKSPIRTAAFALVGTTDDHMIQGVHASYSWPYS